MTAVSYIHGFSDKEYKRLVDQAAMLAPAVFGGLDLGNINSLLEIGCGVGAQTRQLLQRWPGLTIHAIDRNPAHLNQAADYLKHEIESGQVVLAETNAEDMPFKDGQFDAAITIWVLEHVQRPEQILSETRRVLKPGGKIFLHEVDNSTFEFNPVNEIIHNWWDKYNDFQQEAGADPFIGQRIEDLARDAGFINIKKAPLYVVSSVREPHRRQELLHYLRDLLLSGADSLRQGGYVSDNDEKELKDEFSLLETIPGVDFEYTAVRTSAEKPL